MAAAARDAIYGVEPRAWLGDAPLSALADWAGHGTTLPARLLQRIERSALDLGHSAVRTMPSTAPKTCSEYCQRSATATSLRARPYGRAHPSNRTACTPRTSPAGAGLHTAAWQHGRSTLRCTAGRPCRWLSATAFETVHQHTAVARHRSRARRDRTRPAYPSGRGARRSCAALPHRRPDRVEFSCRMARFSQGLCGRPVADAAHARRDAVLLAQALDPCVAFSVEVADA